MKQLVWLLLLLSPVILFLCLFMGASGMGFPSLSSEQGRLILSLRLQRVIAGFVVGAGLSCAGAVLQAILRNPLAEPYVLGVSSGAALGAALAILTGIAAVHAAVLPGMAFVFAAATLMIVYFLARAGGRLSVYSLILSGVIVSAMGSSILMFLIALAPVKGLHSVLWWMLGNLQVADAGLFWVSAALVGIGCAGLWMMSGFLNALALGPEAAHHVGVRTDVVTAISLGLATLLASACVSIAGLIGFVGLMVPHIVRTMVGADHRKMLPLSMLLGGVFLALCDAVARTLLAGVNRGPVEIPVGVITALLGGPFFLVLLFRRRRGAWVE